jgi:cyclohexanone monooxygenase
MPLLDETGYVPTEKYARCGELLAHAQMLGRRYGLYERALFQTEVKKIVWDAATSLWTVHTDRGDNLRARFVVSAAGPLHRPKLPGLKGIESFKGHSFHSSRWDYEYTGGNSNGNLHKLADKRVGIIGTGATAVQM